MGKLKEIKSRFKRIEESVELVSNKVVEIESFTEDFSELKLKFDQIYDTLLYEPTEEEMKEEEKQAEEQITLMKEMIQASIIELINKPENQENIKQFVAQFTSSLTGQGEGLPFDISQVRDEYGNIDLLSAGLMWWANKGKAQGTGKPTKLSPANPTKRTGAYG